MVAKGGDFRESSSFAQLGRVRHIAGRQSRMLRAEFHNSPFAPKTLVAAFASNERAMASVARRNQSNIRIVAQLAPLERGIRHERIILGRQNQRGPGNRAE